MARLLSSTPLTLHSAVADAGLTLPPTTFGAVPASWTTNSYEHVSAFDLVIYGAGASSLTSSALYGAVPMAATIADDTIDSVDTGADTVTQASHGLYTGDGPVRYTTSGTLPGGISAGTDYWVIRTSANAFQLATSFANALAGTAIDITSSGSGTHTMADTADTKTMRWLSMGALTTPIAITAQSGYAVRVNHNPAIVAYALDGSLSASTITVKLYPVVES